MPFKVKVVKLDDCDGDEEKMEKTIKDKIEIWMRVHNTSIDKSMKVAAVTYSIDTSSHRKIVAFHAYHKTNANIPCPGCCI